MNKKLLLGMGVMTAMEMPMLAVVSCGENESTKSQEKQQIKFTYKTIHQGGWGLTPNGKRIHTPEHELKKQTYTAFGQRVSKYTVDGKYIYYDILADNIYCDHVVYGEPKTQVPQHIDQRTGQIIHYSMDEYNKIYGQAWRWNYADMITTDTRNNYNEGNPRFDVRHNLPLNTKVWNGRQEYKTIQELIDIFKINDED